MRSSLTLTILCLVVLASACPEDKPGGLQEEKIYEDQLDNHIVRVTETVFRDHTEHRVLVKSAEFSDEHMLQISAIDYDGNWQWDEVELCAQYRCRRANLNTQTQNLEWDDGNWVWLMVDYKELDKSIALLERVIPRVFVKKYEIVGSPMYVEDEQYLVTIPKSGMMGYVWIKRQPGRTREITVDLNPLESNTLNKRTMSGVDKHSDGRFDQLRVWERPHRGWNEVTRNYDGSITWSSCELDERFALLTEEEIEDVERQLRDVLKRSGYVPR